MCSVWNAIADELRALAADRHRAASIEPDPPEREMLVREAVLLGIAAAAADTPPDGPDHECIACDGVVVQSEALLIWGIGDGAERALRLIASYGVPDPATIDAQALLATLLGLHVGDEGAGAPASAQVGMLSARTPALCAVCGMLLSGI